MDETARVLAESVLVNKVEKDSIFTEVDTAYKLPAFITFPVRVEKYRLVAVRLEVMREEQNKVLPVSVEKTSFVTIREEAVVRFAANELMDIIEDVNELRVREETRVVDAAMVLPIILETDRVLQ